MNKHWIISLGIIVAVGIIGGVWYWSKNMEIQKYMNEVANTKYEWQKTKDNEKSLQDQISTMLLERQKTDTWIRSYAQATSTITGGVYTNNSYKFSFIIPPSWTLISEETNVGSDSLRINLSVPNYKDPNDKSWNLMIISVTNKNFEQSAAHLDILGGEEEKITVAGRPAIKRQAYYESSEKITAIAVSNGDHAIEFYLYNDDPSYISQFEALLKSFKFTE